MLNEIDRRAHTVEHNGASAGAHGVQHRRRVRPDGQRSTEPSENSSYTRERVVVDRYTAELIEENGHRREKTAEDGNVRRRKEADGHPRHTQRMDEHGHGSGEWEAQEECKREHELSREVKDLKSQV